MRWYTVIVLCGLLSAIMISARPPKVHPRAPAAGYPASTAAAKAIKDAKKWTVLISQEGWGQRGRGTGVLLDPTHVLTCSHVMEGDNDKTLVYFYPGYITAHGRQVYADLSKDLAIVEIDVPAWAATYAGFTTVHYDGEPVTVIGNALGSLEWFVSYGTLGGENSRDLLASGVMYHGDSGGPWIDSYGRIVAITDWGIESNDGSDSAVYGGIASHTVYDFLVAYKKTLKGHK